MQPDLFSYTQTMRQRRINIVKQVLKDVPLARRDGKTLLIEVWKRELGDKCFCPTHIKFLCSSPAGIDRDRRRDSVKELYPIEKFEEFKSYKDEFSDHTREKKWSDSYD